MSALWSRGRPLRYSREPVSSEEQFSVILHGCVNSKTMLQLNAVISNDSDIGQLVREYLNREGPGLLRDLMHQNKICCCHEIANGAATRLVSSIDFYPIL